MRLDDKALHIKTHAYNRYSERVEKVTYADLVDKISALLKKRKFVHGGDCIKIGDVWFIYALSDEAITLTTCYGVLFYDLPAALRWQKENHDRIALIG